ncbi:hypothetical protein BD779DRAFT_1414809, partial [Infundibulicybe gibba]
VAVELGFRLGIELGIFKGMAGHSFLVRSDNSGVVTVMNKGRSRSRETNMILKNVYQLLAQNQIFVKAEYISSRENVSDALSRGDVTGFL